MYVIVIEFIAASRDGFTIKSTAFMFMHNVCVAWLSLAMCDILRAMENGEEKIIAKQLKDEREDLTMKKNEHYYVYWTLRTWD